MFFLPFQAWTGTAFEMQLPIHKLFIEKTLSEKFVAILCFHSIFIPIFQILVIFIETHLVLAVIYQGFIDPFHFQFRLEFFPYIWMILNPPTFSKCILAFLYWLNCQFLNLWKHYKFSKVGWNSVKLCMTPWSQPCENIKVHFVSTTCFIDCNPWSSRHTGVKLVLYRNFFAGICYT